MQALGASIATVFVFVMIGGVIFCGFASRSYFSDLYHGYFKGWAAVETFASGVYFALMAVGCGFLAVTTAISIAQYFGIVI
jgi:hypothetical protein